MDEIIEEDDDQFQDVEEVDSDQEHSNQSLQKSSDHEEMKVDQTANPNPEVSDKKTESFSIIDSSADQSKTENVTESF